MKQILQLIVFIVFITINLISQGTDDCNCPNANPSSVELTRALSRDIFELNGVPFMQPLVEALNATSNSRFFSTAKVPVKVKKPYFRLSFNGMFGQVTDDMRSYVPELPNEQFSVEGVTKSGLEFNVLTGQITKFDTAKVVRYLFRTLVYDGINGATNTKGDTSITKGTISTPSSAATILGKSDAKFNLNNEDLKRIAKNRIDLLNALSPNPNNLLINQAVQDTIYSILGRLPGVFTLPPGGDFRMLGAGIPQLEIGSLYGTELLIRFVPKVNLGTNVGDFMFYGFGLKHNLNQYLPNPEFMDLAIQAIYQGTSLENTVGVTSSRLVADAQIYNFNIHASKSIEDWFDVYAGISYDILNIDTKFTYTLSQEVQVSLGLLKRPEVELPPGTVIQPDPANGYPGDTRPQTSFLGLNSNQARFVFGLRKEIGNFSIFLDANISAFTVFSGGIAYVF
jgi:hypothetical protein